MESCNNSNEIYAAIATAIHAYSVEISNKGEHDMENTVLTINRIAGTYSPWSSKFLSLRRSPR